MSPRRYSPSKRSGRGELIHFLMSLALLAVAAVCFFYLVVERDYSGSPAEPAAKEVTDDLLVALPTVKIAEAKKDTFAPPESIQPTDYTADIRLTEYNVIEQKDGGLLLLRGWGYIESLDAANSALYIKIEPIDNAKDEAYLFKATSVPGSTGVAHTRAGENLDQADFLASIRIADLPDGRYALGLMISNSGGNGIIQVSEQFVGANRITVAGGSVTVH